MSIPKVPIGVDKVRHDSTQELEFRYTVSRHMMEMTGFINLMGKEVAHQLTKKIIETQLQELTEAVVRSIDVDKLRKHVEDEIAKAAVAVWRET